LCHLAGYLKMMFNLLVQWSCKCMKYTPRESLASLSLKTLFLSKLKLIGKIWSEKLFSSWQPPNTPPSCTHTFHPAPKIGLKEKEHKSFCLPMNLQKWVKRY